uniref:Alpha-mannosidase n=1 Tax=Ascaris lumbricoides TaxID=6252 RepID=A0A0M3IXE5_ASCLU
QPKSYAVRHEAPIDWLVVDLVFDHFVTTDENVTLQANDWSHNFRIYGYKIAVKQSISHLEGTSLSLDFLSTYGPSQRIFTVYVDVVGR